MSTAARTATARWTTLAVVMLAAFMDLLDVSIVAVAAPAISADLGADDAQLQWTVAVYTLALGCTLITGGRLGDLAGRRRVFLLGLAAFTLASLACAAAPSAEWLIAARVAQGAAAGLMVPQVLGIVRAAFDGAERAKALAAYGGILGLASVAGPLLGGLLVEADLFGSGWRGIFLVNVPVGVVGIVVGMRVLPRGREARASALDLPGAALLAVAAVLVLLPLVQGREWGWPWWSFALLAASVPVLAVLVARSRALSRRGGTPLLEPALLADRSFGAALVVVLLFFGAIGAFFLYLVLYLQIGTGRGPLDTGLVMLPYAVGSILTAGAGVQLASRAGRTLLIAGAVVLAVSQVWLLAVVGGDPGYWALALPLLVGGMGLGLTAPSLINVALAGVPPRDAGTAAGVLTTTSQIGSAAGVAVLGVVFFDRAAATGSAADAFAATLP